MMLMLRSADVRPPHDHLGLDAINTLSANPPYAGGAACLHLLGSLIGQTETGT
jgi:hypothetical protein